MTTKPKSFHVTEYIEDECAARGWSLSGPAKDAIVAEWRAWREGQ